jgi:hypothetical protein
VIILLLLVSSTCYKLRHAACALIVLEDPTRAVLGLPCYLIACCCCAQSGTGFLC